MQVYHIIQMFTFQQMIVTSDVLSEPLCSWTRVLKFRSVFPTYLLLHAGQLKQENIATIFCRIPCAGVQGEKRVHETQKTQRWTTQIKKYLSHEKIVLLL